MKRLLLSFFAFSLLVLTVPCVPKLFDTPEDRSVIHVLHAADGTVYPLSAEDYVLGVMESAGYDEGDETMKAIAAALRSSALYCEKTRPVHKEAAVCDDPDCCMAFRTDVFSEKALRAVAETAGMAVPWEGIPACCPVCEDAGGRTASCEQQYGVFMPYLVSVTELFPCAPEVLTVPMERVLAVFGEGAVEGEPVFACDGSGRVREVRCGDSVCDGALFAETLGLPSLLYTVVSDGNAYRFSCFGRGDGVGLSVGGASRMEQNGYTYKEILGFYFPGTIFGAFD